MIVGRTSPVERYIDKRTNIESEDEKNVKWH
jgi:hypothetical protein